MYFPVDGSMKVQIESIFLPVLIVLLGALGVVAYGNGVVGPAVSDPAALLVENGNGIPLPFVPNVGQRDESVRYMFQQSGAAVSFVENGLAFSWVETAGDLSHTKMVELEFLGAETTAVHGENVLPGIVNYLQGNDRSNWHTNIPTFGSVSYENLYPGVDLVYSGSGRELVATFQLENETKLDEVVWQYMGASVEIDPATGVLSLLVNDRTTPIQLAAPMGWQVIAGETVPLSLNYTVGSDGQIGLNSADGVSAAPTFVVVSMGVPAGSGLDLSRDIAVDNMGNVYVSGITTSADFPTVNPIQPHAGSWDMFVSKFSADGSTLLYSTFIGGSGNEWAKAIAVDSNGAAYLTGETHSDDFPTVNPIQSALNGGIDVFVSMLSPDGSSLLYSTYFGGSDAESGTDIYPKNNDIYLIGQTNSSDFPTQNAAQPVHGGEFDAFFTKLTPGSNTLVYSSFLGGDFDDYSNGLAVDGNDNVIVVGETNSNNFPTASPIQANYMGNWDLFLTAVAADGGSYLYSTYLGGSYSDYGKGVAIDGAGNVHLTGYSNSNDFPLVDPFPVANPYGTDAIVATISSDGSTILFSGLLGASDDDRAFEIALDGNGNKYLVGYSTSPDFPLQNPIQSNFFGFADIIVTKLDVNNEMVFSSYLGGGKIDLGRAIAVDGAQNVYITGDTMSFDFPVVNAFQPGYKGGAGDVVVVKIDGSNYVLDYSTYLGGGPYPGNPTAVSVTDFDGRSELFNALIYLAAALLLVLLVGGAFVFQQRERR